MDSICSRHGISKGMMYHYYANKDDLFLLCAGDTFAALKAHVEQAAQELEGQDAPDAIKQYFLIRESFFQRHPLRKNVFENAMLRPPKHLEEQIRALRQPIAELNRRFLGGMVSRMRLRPGLRPEQAAWYLERMELLVQPSLAAHLMGGRIQDLRGMLEATEELLDLMLYGIVRQPGPAEDGKARNLR